MMRSALLLFAALMLMGPVYKIGDTADSCTDDEVYCAASIPSTGIDVKSHIGQVFADVDIVGTPTSQAGSCECDGPECQTVEGDDDCDLSVDYQVTIRDSDNYYFRWRTRQFTGGATRELVWLE